MDAKVKAEWLKALRSEEYEQGTGYLRDKQDRFCCLGVLCDLAVKAKVIPEPHQREGSWHYGDGPEDALYLPDEVMHWAGLDDFNPGSNDGRPVLSDMNDEHYTFTEIADTIEQFY
jgi:hypothetical protein